MPHQPLPGPLYQRVFGVLYQRIKSGIYEPGERLSTEAEFCAEFGVSKATLRQAMGELVARGLVERYQGRGTFVSADPAPEPEHPFVGSLADLIVGTKHLPLRELQIEQGVAFPRRVRDALGMTDSHGTVIRRLREVDGKVFAYTVQYLAPRVSDLVTPEGLRRDGVPTLLHKLGFRLSGAEQSISAELADVEASKRLEIELGAAVLYAERLLLSDRGPVEIVQGWYRGDLYRWQTTFDLHWKRNKLVLYSDREIDEEE